MRKNRVTSIFAFFTPKKLSKFRVTLHLSGRVIVTPNKNRQVCGSDGKTYESECHLKLQACRTQDDIVVQAFGPCKLGELAGTAGPPRPSSPIQFTQQDDGAASKSTRHLLNPEKYYNKYDWTRKETPSDFDGILSGQRFKGKVVLSLCIFFCIYLVSPTDIMTLVLLSTDI